MSREALATLFHPFETGVLDMPGADARALLIGAPAGLSLPGGFEASLLAVQGFRPDFLALQRAGFTVRPEAEGEAYDLALVLAGRHRGENEARLAEGIARVKPGGLVVMAGEKNTGAASLCKRLEDGGEALAEAISRKRSGAGVGIAGRAGERLYSPFPACVPLRGHMAKHHGMVFWLQRTPEAEAFARSIRDWQGPLVDGRFRTAPGMFSFDRIDPGSRLLAAHLPSGATGNAADFCAGWGYLGAVLAEKNPALAIDSFEADHAALEAARKNLTALFPGRRLGFHWSDLTVEAPKSTYDLVAINPPFHQSRSAEPELGQRLVAAAFGALRPRGRLFVVCNSGLPYEKALGRAARLDEMARGDGFKVLRARR